MDALPCKNSDSKYTRTDKYRNVSCVFDTLIAMIIKTHIICGEFGSTKDSLMLNAERNYKLDK